MTERHQLAVQEEEARLLYPCVPQVMPRTGHSHPGLSQFSPTERPTLGRREEKWRPPINLFQDLSNGGQWLPEVAPQVTLQQGQTGVPLCGTQHVDELGVTQTDGLLQRDVQSVDDIQLLL